MIFIGMGWCNGPVGGCRGGFIGMGWCNGPGARVWRGVKPPAHLVPSKSCKNPVWGRFWGREKSPYFDYPTMLGASGVLAPSFL